MPGGVYVELNLFPSLALKLAAGAKHAENDAAEEWAQAAADAAPVDTGRLASSVHAEGNEVIVDAVNEQGHPYGGFVEYGTHDTPAQPFLRPTEEKGRVVLERDLAATLEV
jgi:HK97 gp10 family phage protein